VVFGFWRRWRRRRWLAQAPSPAEQEIVAGQVRFWRRLSPERQQRLLQTAQVLVNERHFEGSRGLQLTAEMKWTVAANAAVMLLGVDDYYFDRVTTILLQPDTFNLPQQGRWIVENVPSAGAAWQFGPIVLSWPDCQLGSYLRRGGRNVIIHEFAHHLDGIDGQMGGSIQMPTPALAEQWDEAAQRELAAMQEALQQGQRTFLDPYAASEPAEYFAVASEFFFERPAAMKKALPEIYHLLSLFYQTDPAMWSKGE